MKLPPRSDKLAVWSPRIWISLKSNLMDSLILKTLKSEKEYLSIQEHEALLAEAKAEVWEKAAKRCAQAFSHGLQDIFADNAQQEREKL